MKEFWCIDGGSASRVRERKRERGREREREREREGETERERERERAGDAKVREGTDIAMQHTKLAAPLNFGGRKRSGACGAVWPPAIMQ